MKFSLQITIKECFELLDLIEKRLDFLKKFLKKNKDLKKSYSYEIKILKRVKKEIIKILL